MQNDFLKTQILPGQPIPHHEHRLLLTVLIIVVLVAVIIVFALWRSVQTQLQEPTVNQMTQKQSILPEAISTQLRNAPPPTQDQIKNAVTQLSAQKGKVTTKNVSAALSKLQVQMK